MISNESEFWAKIQRIQARRRNPSVLSEKEAEEMLEYFQVRRIQKTLDSVRKTILKQKKETTWHRSTK